MGRKYRSFETITSFHPVVYHGTTRPSMWKIIESSGLSAMNRSHVHMGLSVDVVEGYRKGKEVTVFVDAKRFNSLIINEAKVVLSSMPIPLEYLLFRCTK